jgi:O-succinylbenzoate synthase
VIPFNFKGQIEVFKYKLKSNYPQLNFSKAELLRVLNSTNKSEPLKMADRDGALIRLTDQDGHWGVADLHPWPEWDGFSLEDHLSLFKDLSSLSGLASRSFSRAHVDLSFRKKNSSFWVEFPRPLVGELKIRVKNNFLIVESISKIPQFELEGMLSQAQENGFDIIKIKLGAFLKSEKDVLFELMNRFPHFLWRLDFNSSLSFQQAIEFFKNWTRDQVRAVEYVEDPCAFDLSDWIELNKLMPLAFDRPEMKEPGQARLQSPLEIQGTSEFKKVFKYVVAKTAHVDVMKWAEWCHAQKIRLSLTSSMDHPIGIAHSMKDFLDLQKKYPQLLTIAGLRSSFVYEKSKFSEGLEDVSPFLKAPQGTGFGYDELLKELVWTKLA